MTQLQIYIKTALKATQSLQVLYAYVSIIGPSFPSLICLNITQLQIFFLSYIQLNLLSPE